MNYGTWSIDSQVWHEYYGQGVVTGVGKVRGQCWYYVRLGQEFVWLPAKELRLYNGSWV
tara:strand:- start:5000 stop:5176 length:177 start_codon:yes stop_codon:yes gene_type:complete